MKRSFASPATTARSNRKTREHFLAASFSIYSAGEYCFSHYVAAAFLIPTRFTLLYYDWRGYVIAFLAPVWVANQYMSVYNHLRLDIRTEQVQIHAEQKGGLPRERKAA
jgi:hypothetical protein